MKKSISRESNIELMRIVLMFIIVFGHAMSQTSIESRLSIPNQIITICTGLARPATVCFMILSGMYMNPYRKIRNCYSKLIYTWLKYAIELLIISAFCIIVFDESVVYLMYSIFPLTWRPLWYVSCYVMFMSFAPLINLAYLSLESDLQSRRIIATVIGFMVFGIGTISPFLKGMNADIFPTFYSELLVYIVIYLLMLFLREDISRVPQCIWIILFSGFYAFYCVVRILYYLCNDLGLIKHVFGLNYANACVSYFYSHIETLPILLFALSTVMIVRNIKVKNSSIINRLASCTISVYILHQMPILYPHLWDEIFMVNVYAMKGPIAFMTYMICMFLAIYFVAFIMDWCVIKGVNLFLQGRLALMKKFGR